MEVTEMFVDECDKFVDECLHNLKPDCPDKCIAHVIMYLGYAEAVILGTKAEANHELAIFNEDCVGEAVAHLEYVELIDRR